MKPRMTIHEMEFKTKRLVRMLNEATKDLGDEDRVALKLANAEGDQEATLQIYKRHPTASKKILAASDLIDELAAGMNVPRELVLDKLFEGVN